MTKDLFYNVEVILGENTTMELSVIFWASVVDGFIFAMDMV